VSDQSAQTIWKFPLHLAETNVLDVPLGAEVLHVGDQMGTVTIWAKVDPTAEKRALKIIIAGTGHVVPPDAQIFLGTVQQPPYVWHLFAEAAGVLA
jgi:hypothetical protein